MRGTIHGKTIVLEQDPGLPDGETVTVNLLVDVGPRFAAARDQVKDLPPVEGLRQVAGAWAEDAEELDEYLEWSRQQRKVGRS